MDKTNDTIKKLLASKLLMVMSPTVPAGVRLGPGQDPLLSVHIQNLFSSIRSSWRLETGDGFPRRVFLDDFGTPRQKGIRSASLRRLSQRLVGKMSNQMHLWAEGRWIPINRHLFVILTRNDQKSGARQKLNQWRQEQMNKAPPSKSSWHLKKQKIYSNESIDNQKRAHRTTITTTTASSRCTSPQKLLTHMGMGLYIVLLTRCFCATCDFTRNN